MPLFEQDFQVGEVFGTIRRFNPRGGEMAKALYMKPLTDVYPELKLSLTETLQDVTTITRLGSVSEFAKLATQIVTIHGLGFDWPKPGDPSEQIDQAYQHWLNECPDVWDEITKIAEELNNPNGPVLGQTPEGQENDPKSSQPSSKNANG